MAKLPVLSGKEAIQILSKKGFFIVGQKGSHVRMKKTELGKVYVVIIPDHGDLPIGTLKSIIRQAGLSEEEFRN